MTPVNCVHHKTFKPQLGNGALLAEERHNGGFTTTTYRNTGTVECAIESHLIAHGSPFFGVVLKAEACRRLETALARMLRATNTSPADLADHVSIRTAKAIDQTETGYRLILTFDYLVGAMYSDGD